jgi:hypothetical protein
MSMTLANALYADRLLRARLNLESQGYVETLDGAWERPAATHELLCASSVRKDTDWAILRMVDRDDRARGCA